MATSKLQRYTGAQLRQRFARYGIVENARPSWLISTKGERLELDFYLERLGIAVEVQGGQHFKFTPVFHATEWDFQEQLRRDRDKLEICQRVGIDLLYVCKKSDLEIVLASVYIFLRNARRKQELDSLMLSTRLRNQGKIPPSKRRKEPDRTLSAMITYSEMIEQGLKLKQVEKAAMLYKNMQGMLDNGYAPTQRVAIGYSILGAFLRTKKAI